jgi:hypothetical protein
MPVSTRTGTTGIVAEGTSRRIHRSMETGRVLGPSDFKVWDLSA